MSKTHIYLIAGLLTLAGLFSGYLVNSAQAIGGGPYTIMRHSNETATASVFRLDQRSGGVSYCYVTPQVKLICTKEVH